MTSILTNTSAMSALKSLTATNKALDETQSRISSGYRVGQAMDNAAYWSIATTMRSDNKALSTVQDALGLGAAKLDVAYTAMEAAIKVTDQIKTKLVAARDTGLDKSKIQAEITTLQGQLSSNAASASFSGENWLSVNSGASGYSATKTIVASFTRTAPGSVAVGTLNIDLSSTKLFDTNDKSGILDKEFTTTGAGAKTVSVASLDLTAAGIDNDDIDDMISNVDVAIQAMTKAGADLGAAKSRVNLQKDFVKALMDAIDTGVGQLVDADMNEESSKLQALQVQQQLGIQALSIANTNTQGVMKLFQG